MYVDGDLATTLKRRRAGYVGLGRGQGAPEGTAEALSERRLLWDAAGARERALEVARNVSAPTEDVERDGKRRERIYARLRGCLRCNSGCENSRKEMRGYGDRFGTRNRERADVDGTAP